MNCCDEYGNCNQGRDCPIRAERVARIGRKDYDKESLPESPWRRHLRALGYWMLLAILGLMWIAFVMVLVHA